MLLHFHPAAFLVRPPRAPPHHRRASMLPRRLGAVAASCVSRRGMHAAVVACTRPVGAAGTVVQSSFPRHALAAPSPWLHGQTHRLLSSSSAVSSSCSIDGEEEEEEEGEQAEEDDVSEPTFGVFVRYMLRTRGLLPFALHRYCPSSQQHYVVTMPRANLLLHSMDFAYVLTPAGPLTPQQEKAEAAAETAAAAVF